MKYFGTLGMILVLFFGMTSFVLSQEESAIDEAIRLTNFGVDAARKGLWDEANYRWKQALEAFPNFPAAHNNLGVSYEHLGDFDLAKKHYEIALELAEGNHYIDSNNRMFRQFYYYLVNSYQKADENKRALSVKKDQELSDDQRAETRNADTALQQGKRPESGNEEVQVASTKVSVEDGKQEVASLIAEGETYHKVGSQYQVFITHPKRQTPMSGKYRKIYVAGFSPVTKDLENLNFETTEFLRSELRKYALYEIVPLEELALPTDPEQFDQLIDDEEFWQRLGNKVGADLIVYGLVNFFNEPSDGFYPYEYYNRSSGQYRTAQILVQRTAFSIELDLFFHEANTGELVHEESFGQTIIYRGRLDLTLQAFYDVLNRILPKFMDLMVPRERDALRFVING